MTQRITTDSNCGFLTFLNDGKVDKIYPLLRMYKDKHFLFVDGKDSQKISISRNKFKVYIDDVLYADLSTAEGVLNTAIECVNEAAGGGGVQPLDPDAARKAQQLLQITESELTNENLREKGDVAVLTYSFDLTAPDTGLFSFPYEINKIIVAIVTPPLINQTVFQTVALNTIDELVYLWNSLTTDLVLSKKSDSEVWVEDGDLLVSDVVSGDGGITLFKDAIFSRYQSASWVTALKQTKEDPISNVDFIEVAVNELLDKTNIRPLLPSTLDPVVISGNVAEVALLANPNRKQATIYVEGGDLWLRQMPAANEPSNRKGIRPIENGGSYDLSPHADNGFYLGEYSVINKADGETPTFYVTESI